MKKSTFFLLLLCCGLNFLQAQKLIRKTLVHPGIEFFQIDSNHCFKVDLQTVRSEEMVVEATIDGEYRKDLLVKITEEGNTIKVSTGFQPNFVNPNDKLSAHKVISIALKISLPEYQKVQLFGNSSQVEVNGRYTDLDIRLNDGRCVLNNVSENVKVKTQSGNITLNSQAATIRALSRYGKIYRAEVPAGDDHFDLSSTSGDIHINRISP